MSRASSLRRVAVVALLLSAVAAAAALSGRGQRAEASAGRLSEAEVLELDLAFFEARVARDSFAARDHAQLARLYLERARRGGMADADLARAEEHARRPLALRSAHNGEALQILASTLMGRHQFLEARASAERLLVQDSTSLSARALLGEIQVELGAYREAARTFGTLLTARTDLAVAPRYALVPLFIYGGSMAFQAVQGSPIETRTIALFAMGIPLLTALCGWTRWKAAP